LQKPQTLLAHTYPDLTTTNKPSHHPFQRIA
jgi:hypothetical protein